MNEKSSFFNDVDGDRVYYAEDFAEYFIPFFTNGIFNNGCNVLAENDNMSINVSVGRAFINGYRYYNSLPKTLTVENADGVLNRIDNVVIRLDLVNRTITAQIVKGTFAEQPVAPDLVRSSTIYDLRIAKISIPAGTTTITQDLVTDTRFINSDCGNVISPIETPDTEDLFIQIQTAFEKQLNTMNVTINQFKTDSDTLISTTTTNFDNKIKEFTKTFNDTMSANSTTFSNALRDYGLEFGSWFDKVKDTLGTDVAGALLNAINEVSARVDEINVPTKTSELENDSHFIADDKYVHTDNNYSDAEKKKITTNTNNITKLLNGNLKSFISTLPVANWNLNGDTNFYENDVKKEDITSKHFIEVTMDIPNQEKIVDGYVNSYDGGFKVITSEKPEADIDISVTYQLTNIEGGN